MDRDCLEKATFNIKSASYTSVYGLTHSSGCSSLYNLANW